MQTWTKALAIAATAAAAMTMTGCSGSTTTEGASATSDKSEYVIGYDSYFVGNSWSAQLQAEFESGVARDKGEIADVVMTQSDNDAQKQISNLQSMIARKVDAIIVTPISPDGIVPVLKQASNAGIKVTLNASNASTEDYTSYVNVDDKTFGATGAEWLVDKLDGKGNILAINGIAGVPTSDLRFAGADNVFKENPGIKVVSTIDGGWDQATTKTAVESALAANPNIDGVWSQGGSMTLGAIEAFEAAGVPLVPMTGEDNNGLLKKWQALKADGTSGFDCIAVSKPTSISAQALENTLASLKGESVEKDMILEPAVITSDNLADFVRDDMPDSFWVQSKMTDDEIKALFKN